MKNVKIILALIVVLFLSAAATHGIVGFILMEASPSFWTTNERAIAMCIFLTLATVGVGILMYKAGK